MRADSTPKKRSFARVRSASRSRKSSAV
jgi:hypothetical protein